MVEATSAALPSRSRATVSVLFDSSQAVDAALTQLVNAGVPRDLIEVVVSPQAAKRFYEGKPIMREWGALRYAGSGGLLGMVLGAGLSLFIVALPGFQEPGLIAWVQLLGPNVATVSGAVLGALYGLFVRRTSEPRHARAAAAPDAIVLVVTSRSEDEAARLVDLLQESGGREPQIA